MEGLSLFIWHWPPEPGGSRGPRLSAESRNVVGHPYTSVLNDRQNRKPALRKLPDYCEGLV
jgi:hypothetical protein